MDVLSAAALRDLARDALLAAGFRGFVRVAPAGGPLLVTDAGRRAGPAGPEDALRAAGFPAERAENGLLFFSPEEGLLRALAESWTGQVPAGFSAEGDGALLPARSLAARLLRAAPAGEWTAAGWQLLLEALRLPDPSGNGWPEAETLRPRLARMLREGDRSAMRETGALMAARLSARA